MAGDAGDTRRPASKRPPPPRQPRPASDEQRDGEEGGAEGTKGRKKVKGEGREGKEAKEAKVDPAIAPLLAETAEVAQSHYRDRRRKWNHRRGRDSDDDDDEEAAPLSPTSRLAEWTETPDQLQARLLIGHDVFNSDTAHLHYTRRLQRAKAAGGGAVSGVSALKAGGVASYVDRAAPSEAAIDRLVEDMEAQQKRSTEFSRRRRFNEGEDVSYISDRNRHFNQKISRAFDQFTLDIAQNIERGTAL